MFPGSNARVATATGLIWPIAVACALSTYRRVSVRCSHTPAEADRELRLPALQNVDSAEKLANQLHAFRRFL